MTQSAASYTGTTPNCDTTSSTVVGTNRTVEVYPAARLRCWNPHHGYKGPASQDQRESSSTS
jgi:hypothetical protein